MSHIEHQSPFRFSDFDNFVDVIGSNALTAPEHPALIEGDRLINYRELLRLILCTARHLTELGLGPSERIGLILKDHADHLILICAAASMGAATVSIDWRGKIEEKRRIAEAFGLKFLVCESGTRSPETFPTVLVDKDWSRNVETCAPLPPLSGVRSRPFRILLTSGTTGVPKGVELSHDGLMSWSETISLGLGLTGRQRHLSLLPIGFTGSLVFNLPQLLLGNTIDLFPPLFSPGELVDAIKRRGITSCVVVPTILRRLLPLARSSEPLLPKLKFLISLGAPLSARELHAASRMLTPHVFNNYGASGAGPITFLRPPDIALKAGSVGVPAPLRTVQIVTEAGQPVPRGKTGLLRCMGPGVAKGFCNANGASNETFRDGWYYPGELAQIDEDGFLYLMGRSAEIILRGGVNIYPNEIEKVLLRHPNVNEAVVVGMPSEEYGEEAIAFVDVSDGTSARDLMEECRRSLAQHKVPKEILFVDQVPRNAVGKVDKSELLRKVQPTWAVREGD